MILPSFYTSIGTLMRFESATYYAITDHLGSVLKLVDSKVHSKYEARYTPFGVRTIVKNDLGYNFPRGYTMHEHLDDVGTLYVFNETHKKESTGYDAAIVYWWKRILPPEKVARLLRRGQ